MTTPLPLDLEPALASTLRVVATELGTPCYVYDLERVSQRLEELVALREILPLDLFFSPKPNPAPSIARRAIEAGCGIDACSAFDVLLASRLGLEGDAISFCTHALGEEDLDAVVATGAHFVADSESQLERYRIRVPDGAVGVRVNVGVAAGFHAHVAAAAPSSRFGVPLDEVADLVDRVGGVTGLHCHIGSDVESSAQHLAALDVLLGLARELGPIEYVNLGGGYRIPFVQEEEPYDLERLAQGAASRLAAFEEAHGWRPRLRLEPGNYVTRDAGYLLVRVVEVRGHSGAQLLQVDGNVGQLPGALLYGTEHPVALIGERTDPLVPTEITGVLMQPGDRLRRSVALPPACAGHLLAFGLAGAYSGVRASTFNGRPLPAEVVIDGPEHRLVRRRLSPADLVADWLS